VRWLVPSAVAACAGALVAGLVEGRHASSFLGAAVTAGFLALIAAPVLLVASAAVRVVAAAWQPGELARIAHCADRTSAASPRLGTPSAPSGRTYHSIGC